MYKRILIPTDGSDASRRAIAAGVALAQTLHAEVVALTVTPAFHVLSFEPSQVEPSAREFALDNNAHAMRLLDEVSQVAHEAGVPCTSEHAVSDHPFEAIIATARDKGCDVINMASHGRKGIKGFLLGSETQKVLLHSDIPVLVHH